MKTEDFQQSLGGEREAKNEDAATGCMRGPPPEGVVY